MKIYESAQDYLETILILSKNSTSVRSIDIANKMDITKQSVHRAIKNLKNGEYILVDNNGYITLSKKGKEIAEEMYERHQLLTKYFVSLGVNEETALKDACKVEHYLSDETYQAIKKIAQSNK